MPMLSEDPEEKRARARAVHEEYKKLEKFYIERRRITLVDDDHDREGGYGIIRQAELHPSAYLPAWLASRLDGPPQLVAVKQIKLSAVSNKLRAKRAFTREVLVWSSLETHPGIAKFLGFYADFQRAEAWLLSPWEPNGNVNEFIHAHNLEVPEKLALVYDTIDALTFLHQLDPPVCHGDIKSTNVLVSADYRARLCDFGLAQLHEDSGFGRLETSTGSKGSLRWCSPEIIDGAPRAPTSDVYAWAWLVWEIMTGDLPYEGTSAEYAIIRKIFESPLPQVEGVLRFSDCLRAWDLMTRCWNVDPQLRPTARMCKTTIADLPRCTPTPANADQQTRSAALLENLGRLESWKGNSEKASAYLGEALRLYQKEADSKGIANVLLKQSGVAYRCSKIGQAIATATAALDHFRILGDLLGIADASCRLGSSLLRRGQEDEALPFLHEALEIYRTHGNDVGAARCLERIGELQRWKSQQDDALSTLEEALAFASRSGDQYTIAATLRTMGYVHHKRNDFDKATEAISRARPIAQSIGWYAGLSDIGQLMGNIKMQSGEHREAEALFQDSVSNARQGRTPLELASALRALGQHFLRRSKLDESKRVESKLDEPKLDEPKFDESKLDEAASALGEACLLFQELSEFKYSVPTASSLVELKTSQGDWDGALFWKDHIIAMYRSQKEHGEVADHLMEKGEILVEAQRYDEATLHIEASLVISVENGYDWDWELEQLCIMPKTLMKWERRLPLLCDLRKLQRRQPQLRTAALNFSIRSNPGEF